MNTQTVNKDVRNHQLPERPVVAPIIETLSRLMPLWSVILYDDDIHCMDEVTGILMTVMGFCDAEATRIMLQAHCCGRSIVITDYFERSEYHCSRLHAYGLILGLEKAE